MDRRVHINIEQTEAVTAVARALSSELRLQILLLLEEGCYNVNEIAEVLDIPPSSAAMHVKILDEAGLIETELKAAVRGSMKICRKSAEKIYIDLCREKKENAEYVSMPIGSYVDYHAEPTCGIVSESGYIDLEDEPAVFYNPGRTNAGLIWIGNGYLEYRFPNACLKKNVLKAIEISAEVCSEDHEFNMDFESDITLWVNEIEVATWRSPSDFGGRRGKLNPVWWPNQNTQYGMLKTWRIDDKASYLDGVVSAKRPLDDYQLRENDYISVKLGISEDAQCKGGMNLFGNSFGDWAQDLIMKFIYEQPEKTSVKLNGKGIDTSNEQ